MSMNESNPKALVATRNPARRRLLANALLDQDCDVHTASRLGDSLDLLRKQRYDIVLVDETLEGMSPLEFTLNLRDLVKPMPVALVAGDFNGHPERLQRQCELYYMGGADELVERVPDAVREARQRLR